MLHFLFTRFLTFKDSHDAVLRFNAAPTSGYENDVGSKTTIRLVNSQVNPAASATLRYNSCELALKRPEIDLKGF